MSGLGANISRFCRGAMPEPGADHSSSTNDGAELPTEAANQVRTEHRPESCARLGRGRLIVVRPGCDGAARTAPAQLPNNAWQTDAAAGAPDAAPESRRKPEMRRSGPRSGIEGLKRAQARCVQLVPGVPELFRRRGPFTPYRKGTCRAGHHPDACDSQFRREPGGPASQDLEETGTLQQESRGIPGRPTTSGSSGEQHGGRLYFPRETASG